MQKSKNDAIQAQQDGESNILTTFNSAASNIVRHVFRPLVSSASPLTVGSTSVQAHDSDWLSPEAPPLFSRPPQQIPFRRSNTVRKVYSTEITWGDRESFSEYMHDCYGGNNEYDLLPIIPLDSMKHPWNKELLADLCKIRINCILRSDKDYVEKWILAIAKGISVSPVPYIKDFLSYPPDIVDDTYQHLDDPYHANAPTEAAEKEEMGEEAYEEDGDDGFNYHEIQE